MYYKAKLNNMIVDALDNPQCVRFFTQSGILRCSEKENPQGIISSDGQHIWHVEGWPSFPTDSFDTVELVRIGEDEYKKLKAELKEWRELLDVDAAPDEEAVHEEIAITPAKAMAIMKELSKTVNDLQEQNDFLCECVLEMSEAVYG